MRAARLVQLLLLLQTRGQMSAPALARELEVSVRTIYRDLEALSGAGVPVYSETGRNGGARLVDGYRTRLTGLTVDEADALLLAGVPGPAAQLGLGTVLAAAQLKVLAALPPELRSRATRVQERFHLDAPGWFQRTEETPHLAAVAEALWSDRRVEIGYQRTDQVVTRLLDPLGLVSKAGVWYLVARIRNDERDDIRTYRASRIVHATVVDETFTRPAGFDLAAHWDASARAFEQSTRLAEGTVRVLRSRARALRWIVESEPVLSSDVDRRSSELGDDPWDDDWVLVTIPCESLEVLALDLVRLGGDVEVLGPPELRERVLGIGRSIVARYDAGGAEPAGSGAPASAASSRVAIAT